MLIVESSGRVCRRWLCYAADDGVWGLTRGDAFPKRKFDKMCFRSTSLILLLGLCVISVSANAIRVSYDSNDSTHQSNYLRYSDWVPSQSYYSFALAAGCWGGTAYGFETTAKTIFDCLITKDTQTLQNASFYVSATANYGIWGFLPVTDKVYIQNLPSVQLAEGRVNGIRMLVGVRHICSAQSRSWLR